MQLLTAEGVVTVTSALEPRMRHALCHVFALHGHDACCPVGPQVHIEPAAACACGDRRLRRDDRGAPAAVLSVRPACGAAGPRDIALGMLDAFAHLAARRLPIELQRAGEPGS